MANTSLVTVTLTLTGDMSSPPNFLWALNTSAPNSAPLLTLAIGDNSFAVPTGAVGLLVELPASNTILVKAKGAGGDTGLSIHKTNVALIPLDSSMATVILNAAAQITGVRLIWV